MGYRVRSKPPKINSAYYLPPNIFRSTVYFCLTYRELKAQRAEFTGLKAFKADGMPRGNNISDPTPIQAEGLMRIERKIDTIEQAVSKCAGGELFDFMLSAVTEEGITFAKQQARGIPLNRNEYNVLRRKIYYEVAKHT